jgi:hypothetical protein
MGTDEPITGEVERQLMAGTDLNTAVGKCLDEADENLAGFREIVERIRQPKPDKLRQTKPPRKWWFFR